MNNMTLYEGSCHIIISNLVLFQKNGIINAQIVARQSSGGFALVSMGRKPPFFAQTACSHQER